MRESLGSVGNVVFQTILSKYFILNCRDREVLWNIPLRYVKTCHCDWLNKKLKGHLLGKKRLGGHTGDRELWKEKRRVASQVKRKQDGQYRVRVTESGIRTQI